MRGLNNLNNKGVFFVISLISEHGERAVTQGIKKIAKIDLNLELTEDDIIKIEEYETQIKNFDFKALNVEFRERRMKDNVNSKISKDESELQAKIAHKVMFQTSWMVPLFIVFDAGFLMFANDLGAGVSASLTGITSAALMHLYCERKQLLSFLYGATYEKKDTF